MRLSRTRAHLRLGSTTIVCKGLLQSSVTAASSSRKPLLLARLRSDAPHALEQTATARVSLCNLVYDEIVHLETTTQGRAQPLTSCYRPQSRDTRASLALHCLGSAGGFGGCGNRAAPKWLSHPGVGAPGVHCSLRFLDPRQLQTNGNAASRRPMGANTMRGAEHLGVRKISASKTAES